MVAGSARRCLETERHSIEVLSAVRGPGPQTLQGLFQVPFCPLEGLCRMPMMTLSDLQACVARIAPEKLAAPWDNAGLILGDPAWVLGPGPILLTIDLTSAVLEEVAAVNASAVVAYHPPIFSAMKRFTPADRAGMTVLEFAARRVGIVSPHTALDAAPNGLADWLLEQCAPKAADITDRGALQPYMPASSSFKVVTFVPLTSVDAVADAMANAGAGNIGKYTNCSFRVDGTGTFLGSETTNPAVGTKGELEHVGEMRLEMISPQHNLPEVIAALRTAHPYEEPAFDVYGLADAPDAGVGAGRIGTLAKAEPAKDIIARIAKRLGISSMKYADDPAKHIQRVAVCPGSGGSLAEAAAVAGADLFVTGEMTHHAVLGSLERGLSVALAGHTETERPYLPTLAKRIAAEGINHDIVVAKTDCAPLRIMLG